ncbi:hypothetical protein CRE_02091 [Caenorhabditis remanei]|uniref:SKP1 component POZ domain-containing protein n=1 Tax=Caenorhabditis remanei TaxID=31234 RepID=E3LEZ2_CAERE|nr:hypothetical protein CRE_02091 [Caenorhabditis remanei]
MSSEKVYKVETSDKQVFEMNLEDISQSITLSEQVDYLEDRHPHLLLQPIQIPNVNGEIMQLVVKWCYFSRVDCPNTSRWCADFLKILTKNELNGFISAADELIIPSIIHETKYEMMRRVESMTPGLIQSCLEIPGTSGSNGGPNKPKIVVKYRRK